jgi:hypothetical protein
VASAVVAAGLITPAEAEQINASLAVGQITPETLPDALNRALAKGEAAKRALGFLGKLFKPTDVIELRAVDPAGGGAASCCGRMVDPAQRNALRDFINAHNGLWNTYFGVNPRPESMAGTTRAARNENVTARHGVALDCDLKDAPDADPDWSRTLDALKALGPAAVVDTGNGWHIHFLIDRIHGTDAASAATAPIKEVMSVLGSDDVADLPRIMRLPNTVNLPTDSKRKRGCV